MPRVERIDDIFLSTLRIDNEVPGTSRRQPQSATQALLSQGQRHQSPISFGLRTLQTSTDL